MKIRILGCSGGIGGGLHTTSILVDHDILIDAGTGVSSLTLDEMAGIQHLFLTHTHLDHIACLPLMVDSIFDRISRQRPLIIHALPASIDALQKHIFNWAIWPDFASLPSADQPVIRYQPLNPGQPLTLGERTLEMLPTNHIVPTVGYAITTATGALAFSGDTTTNDTFWAGLNRLQRLDLLIVETAFSNKDEELSKLSRHYCPSLLAADLKKLRHRPQILLTHNKPGEEQRIWDECQAEIQGRTLIRLVDGNTFEL
ncbi:MAG: 3',5'-cyclic-nucleotide phosphodiesterase [Gammaproteobacteria bacterium]|nr:3',5'-cyclic-nucleotide phosphodiesterase [Gammaproteobacteria bacterium]